LPLVVLHAHGEVVAGDAGVVHQHMQPAVLLGDGVDQGFGGGRVVDVQLRAAAAGVLRQRPGDLPRAVVGGGGADHLHAAGGELVGDGGTDAARGAGDQ